MALEIKSSGTNSKQAKIHGELVSEMFAFEVSMKLYHWNVTGRGSYSQHIALDQAIEQASDVKDRMAETAVSQYGPLNFKVNECTEPKDIITYCQTAFNNFKSYYSKMNESYQTSILDDYCETVQQVLFRLKRLY